MRMQPKCLLFAIVSMSVIATASPTLAARLYLGLPNGTHVAYARAPGASTWTRDATVVLPDVGYYASPALADLDDDGDHDALVGESTGRTFAYLNSGSDAAPTWIRQPGWDPGYDVGSRASPALADLDKDGDLDVLIGNTVGDLFAFENVGSKRAPAWRPKTAWELHDFGEGVHPTLGDLDRDGRVDLLIGREQGDVQAFGGVAGAAPFARKPEWDPPIANRPVPGLGDIDGDGRLDLIVADGRAVSVAYRLVNGAWSAVPEWSPPDPGSGPAVPALIAVAAGPAPTPVATPGSTETTRPPTAVPTSGTQPTAVGTAAPVPTATPVGGNRPPVARLATTTTTGTAPHAVDFDASASADPEGTALRFDWDFGDGTTAGSGVPSNPGAALTEGAAAYETAKATRDAGDFAEAVALYLDDVALLLPLTAVTTNGPLTIGSTSRIDRVARWYLQRIGHDLGAIYLYRNLGPATCDRYGLALQYSRESVTQAVAGGFPQQPELNGTNANITEILQRLAANGCPVPAPQPMFVDTGAGARVSHTYTTPGSYLARVTVSDGVTSATASAAITVGSSEPPPGGGGDGNADALEGFGASTPGGTGGRVIRVSEATDAAVQAAIRAANAGNAIVVFDVTGPIVLAKELVLTGGFITIEGNGVTLLGHRLGWQPILEVKGHDVIARNLRLRNGSDNLRAQGTGAYNIVFSHISSTGAADDGVSIAYGAHDVTLQHSFLAGNTRSIFIKYGTTTNVSIHHTWIMKQWARGPLVSSGVVADLRNLIVEDWTSWGVRFEKESSGNLLHSLFTLGPTARALGGAPTSAFRLTQSGPVFTAGNVYEGLAANGPNGKAAAPVAAPPVGTLPVSDMEAGVRARAGCLPRDAVDAKYIATTTGWRVGAETPLRVTVP